MDADLDEDDIEGKRMYGLDEKLVSAIYCHEFVKELKGEGAHTIK